MCRTSPGFYVTSIGVVVTKNDIFHKNYLQAYFTAAINSVTINSTGRVWGRWLPGCMLSRCVSAVQSFTKSSCSGPTIHNSLCCIPAMPSAFTLTFRRAYIYNELLLCILGSIPLVCCYANANSPDSDDKVMIRNYLLTYLLAYLLTYN